MNTYSLYCGDTKIVEVRYKAETPQALSKKEQNDICDLARETTEYKNFQGWWGYGYMNIQLNS